MKQLELETLAGDNFTRVSEKAKQLSIEKGLDVFFEFNGVKCVVNSETNLDFLYRDYLDAHIMDWKIIGPVIYKNKPKEIQEEIDRKKEEHRLKEKAEREAYQKKQQIERAAFEKQIEGIEFLFSNKEAFESWKKNNEDSYGRTCFEYAELWGKRLQKELDKGANLELIKDDFEYQPNYLGISGFQHSAAKAILKECWKYGKEI